MGSNRVETVLVTGGTGYIGSHIAVELIESGYDVVIVDDLSNSSRKVVDRIAEIVGDESDRLIGFFEADASSASVMDGVFGVAEGELGHHIDAVVHCAGFKAVGESVEKPVEYYRNNLMSTLALLSAMRSHGCGGLVFSSSATVYGTPDSVPVDEDEFVPYCFGHSPNVDPKGTLAFPSNPYGWTKWMNEMILSDAFNAYSKDADWLVFMPLRYANPIGAHPSGLIGEDPRGIPNNLLPYVAQVAVGRRERVTVFGDDYDTPDGTGVRDYIHVVDLAKGHVAAIDKMNSMLEERERHGNIPSCAMFEPINLGTGRGTSVLEVIEAFSRACGKEIPYSIEGRRPGDIATTYLSPARAEKVLGWKAELGIDDMCRDLWNWQSKNPDGYGDCE